MRPCNILLCLLLLVPVCSASIDIINMTELNVHRVSTSNELQLSAYFDIGNSTADIPVEQILYQPDTKSVIDQRQDIARYLNETDRHKVYNNVTPDTLPSGTYEIYYIFNTGQNTSYTCMGTFDLHPIGAESPFTYDTSDMHGKVMRFIAFSIVCISVFVFIATRK